MKTVAVLHGWAGGPMLGKAFSRELESSGLKVIKEVDKADFIFAHSTGCYFLPNTSKAQLIVCLDPPYWPGEPIVERWMHMNKNETKFLIKQLRFGRFFRNKLWEVFYIFAKPSYTWSVLRNQSHLDFLEQQADKQIIVVRNLDDEFCSPQIKQAVSAYKNVKYVEIPGYHSNYYTNPKPYIDLLLKEL